MPDDHAVVGPTVLNHWMCSKMKSDQTWSFCADVFLSHTSITMKLFRMRSSRPRVTRTGAICQHPRQKTAQEPSSDKHYYIHYTVFHKWLDTATVRHNNISITFLHKINCVQYMAWKGSATIIFVGVTLTTPPNSINHVCQYWLLIFISIRKIYFLDI